MEGEEGFDELTSSFISWLKESGVTISPKIELKDLRDQGRGRGVVAVADIGIDEELFSVPRSAILLPKTSDFPEELVDIMHREPWFLLVLAMIWELQQGSRSRWYPYLRLLPTHFDQLMFWSEAELALLKGSAVLDKIGKQGAQKAFDEIVQPTIAEFQDEFRAAKLSDQQLSRLFHRVCSIVQAYGFDLGFEEADEDSEELDSDDEDGWKEDPEEEHSTVGMVPLADMLNADADRNNAKLFHETDKVAMRSTKPISAGEEIFNDYGSLPQSAMLRRYGYTTPNYAKYDVAEISRELVMRTVKTMLPSYKLVGELHRKLAGLEMFDIPLDAFDIGHSEANDGTISTELISAVRIFASDEKEFQETIKKQPKPPFKKLASEKADQVLKAILEARLREYPDAAISAVNDRNISPARRDMADAVIKGEKAVLHAALASLDSAKRQAQSSSGSRPNKKQKV